MVVKLPGPSNNTAELTQAGLSGLQAIYRSGYAYVKAGIMLLDLNPQERCQLELPIHYPVPGRNKGKLMPAIDEINAAMEEGR